MGKGRDAALPRRAAEQCRYLIRASLRTRGLWRSHERSLLRSATRALHGSLSPPGGFVFLQPGRAPARCRSARLVKEGSLLMGSLQEDLVSQHSSFDMFVCHTCSAEPFRAPVHMPVTQRPCLFGRNLV